MGAQRSGAQKYFCLVASTQAAPLGMIYDDFLGLFCKHSPQHRRELHSQGLPPWSSRMIVLRADATSTCCQDISMARGLGGTSAMCLLAAGETEA